ncbi:MAG: hypothetical protein FJW35_02890 [Acidobacteria bacterium]|nr:hypothetical protein [Acidobacteriota bacterium]
MRISVYSRPVVIILCGFIVLLPSGGAEATYIVRADRVYTVSGSILEPGDVLVENGRIAGVAGAIQAPAGARELRARTVIPGLVDMHTHPGVYSFPRVDENQDGNEMTDPPTPQVRAMDSFNFDDPALKAGLAGGVTTIVSRPGSANITGGTTVAAKLKLSAPDRMVLGEVCDLKMAIEGNPIGVYGRKDQMPVTLMSVYAMVRRAFIEAQES